jgi:NADH-quinone oxidoreductase subunit J
MELSRLIFYFFGAVAVASSVMMITRRNPVYSAMYLLVSLFAVSALFLVLNAQFIAFLQIIVYAGAILVLFLFVIMLLNLGHDFEPDVRARFWWAIGGGLALVLFAELYVILAHATERPGPDMVTPLVAAKGVIPAVAEPLFNNYFIALELTGVLLLVAMVGAVVIAKQRG